MFLFTIMMFLAFGRDSQFSGKSRGWETRYNFVRTYLSNGALNHEQNVEVFESKMSLALVHDYGTETRVCKMALITKSCFVVRRRMFGLVVAVS